MKNTLTKSRAKKAAPTDKPVEDTIVTPTAPISVPAPVAAPPIQTLAARIWNDIKDRPIEMFGLPNQTPAKYCQMIPADPNKLYLTYKVGSVLTAMELAFKSKYDIEIADRFIIVTPKSTSKLF